jgi:hypothetical protein
MHLGEDRCSDPKAVPEAMPIAPRLGTVFSGDDARAGAAPIYDATYEFSRGSRLAK